MVLMGLNPRPTACVSIALVNWLSPTGSYIYIYIYIYIYKTAMYFIEIYI